MQPTGSPLATLQAAGTRALILAFLVGGLTWLTAYLAIDDSCSTAQTLTVKRLEASQSKPKLLAAARKDAAAGRQRCEKRVQSEKNHAVAAGVAALVAGLGIRGAGEGLIDSGRQERGSVRAQDVQPNA